MNSHDESDLDTELTSFGATDRGRVRAANQDQFLIARLSKSMRITSSSISTDDRLYGRTQGEVLLVADGMGGHAGGERASELAIEHLTKKLLGRIHWHFQDEDGREKEFIEALQKLLQAAHTRILRESSRDANRRGIGTTLTMAYVVWPKLYVLHAGDSRCYLVRGGQAKQLTNDHTLARQMVEAGGLKPEEEAGSKWSNVLYNVLGGRDDGSAIEAEVHLIDLRSDDAIVLCSDGLHRYVTEKDLAEQVDSDRSLSDVCQSLIALANDAGGQDNITVIVSRPNPRDHTKTTWIEPHQTVESDRETLDLDESKEGVESLDGLDDDPMPETNPE